MAHVSLFLFLSLLLPPLSPFCFFTYFKHTLCHCFYSSSACSSTSGCSSSSESDSSSISGTSDTEEDTKAEGAKVGTGKDNGKKSLMLKVTNLPESKSSKQLHTAFNF